MWVCGVCVWWLGRCVYVYLRVCLPKSPRASIILLFLCSLQILLMQHLYHRCWAYCLYTYKTTDAWQTTEQNTLCILLYIKPDYMKALKPSCAPFHNWQETKNPVVLQWGCSRLLYASVHALLPWTGNWATCSAAWHRACVLIEWKSIWVLSDKHRTLDAILNLPQSSPLQLWYWSYYDHVHSEKARTPTGSVGLDKSKFVRYQFNFLNLMI